jgi:rhodanese-related sulfurtransferase/rubrerythrin
MNIADIFTKVNVITADDTKELISNKPQDELEIIDVRQPAEYERGHITGAKLIPLSTLADNIEKLDVSKTIVTYCQRGVRSNSAAALLKRMGFEDIFSMKGGIEAWNGNEATGDYDAGLFLIEGRKTVDEFVTLAWALEEGARIFYSSAMDLVTDTEAKDLLSTLVKAEENHKAALSQTLSRIKEKDMTDDIIKDSSLENIMEGGISVDKAIEWLGEQENGLISVLELSMHLEANSLDLYMKMYNELENDEVKEVFSGLVKEEKTHLARLGNLLNEKIAL